MALAYHCRLREEDMRGHWTVRILAERGRRLGQRKRERERGEQTIGAAPQQQEHAHVPSLRNEIP